MIKKSIFFTNKKVFGVFSAVIVACLLMSSSGCQKGECCRPQCGNHNGSSPNGPNGQGQNLGQNNSSGGSSSGTHD